MSRLNTSQSLWSRAGSFDLVGVEEPNAVQMCLNPFGAGRGLSTTAVSAMPLVANGLNPFRTGRGLSTTHPAPINVGQEVSIPLVSIPLGQGGVFRRLLFLQCR